MAEGIKATVCTQARAWESSFASRRSGRKVSRQRGAGRAFDAKGVAGQVQRRERVPAAAESVPVAEQRRGAAAGDAVVREREAAQPRHVRHEAAERRRAGVAEEAATQGEVFHLREGVRGGGGERREEVWVAEGDAGEVEGREAAGRAGGAGEDVDLRHRRAGRTQLELPQVRDVWHERKHMHEVRRLHADTRVYVNPPHVRLGCACASPRV